MASLDQESLFSLEIVADHLTFARNVCCRFPAIAFRLLDFPTLIIYHVEPDLGQAIKRKIKLETQITVPEQLIELKDKDGVYQVKKGKSCLFKVPPNVLLSHLQNTPLYVMVLDSYPATAKLVGNCMVPLDITMNRIYNDIKREGISKPISHGEKGTYPVYNLMGAEIGQVTFGFRILSLGVGLISHIPDKSVVKMKKSGVVRKSASVTQASQKPIEQEATELILEDLETADENIQVVLSTPRPDKSVSETQTFNMQKVATTQTEEMKREEKGMNRANKYSMDETKRKKLKKEEKRINRVDSLSTMAQITPPCDDIIITNTVCPPALFYNSETDPPYIAPGLTLDDYLVHKQQRDAMKIDSDTESVDSDSTIRHEDRFSETELEIEKLTVKTVCEYPPEPKKQPKKPAKPVVSLGAMADYPLLSALMSEIASLQGVQGAAQDARTGVTTGMPGQRHKVQEARSATQLHASPSKKALRPVSPTRTYMLRKAMSAALVAKPLEEPPSQTPSSQHTTPEHVIHSPRRTSSKKTEDTAKVKKQKSVSAKQKAPVSFSSSTNLAPGMTKSQRLRLLKTNPGLLEKLEKDEKERVEKFKAKRMAMGAGFYSSTTDVNARKHSVDADQYDRYKRKVPKLQLNGHKKPVPTPRTSVHEDHIVVREVPPVVPRKSKHRAKKEKEVEYYEYDDEEYETAESEGDELTSNVINVHMPSARMDDTGSELEYDEVDRQEKDRTMGKTYSSPSAKVQPQKRSPKSRSQASAHQKPNDPFSHNSSAKGLGAQRSEPIAVQYSKDYDEITVTEIAEATDAGEALGLQRMVDEYPDDEDGTEDAGEALGLQKMVDHHSDYNAPTGRDPGEELGLRQIIDKYSDDDDEEEEEEKTESSSTHSQSFHSARSNDSDEPEKSKPKLKIATSLVRTVAPSTSNMSPSIASKPSMATRNPMTESLSTVTESNPDSTAYLHRSEMTNSQFSSIESTGPAAREFRAARKSARKPLVSPRKSLERVHTESVSSYAPSDPDNMAPLSPTAEYSDEFESVESDHVLNVKYMKDAKVAPESRFGYTWSGS